MFTTTTFIRNSKMTTAFTQAALHRAAAFGMAALVTISVLGSIDQLASAPTPNSLLATSSNQPVRS